MFFRRRRERIGSITARLRDEVKFLQSAILASLEREQRYLARLCDLESRVGDLEDEQKLCDMQMGEVGTDTNGED